MFTEAEIKAPRKGPEPGDQGRLRRRRVHDRLDHQRRRDVHGRPDAGDRQSGAARLHPDPSYGEKTKSAGTPQIVHSLTLDIAKRHVLLIDDILDTGKTLALVDGLIRKLNPASLRVCVLLDKQGRREVPYEAQFVGFRIPDKFVVGYGLDFAERYRNLPCIGVLKAELQNPPEWV